MNRRGFLASVLALPAVVKVLLKPAPRPRILLQSPDEESAKNWWQSYSMPVSDTPDRSIERMFNQMWEDSDRPSTTLWYVPSDQIPRFPVEHFK